MNIAQLMIRAGRSYSALPALIQGERVLANYGELAERVARLAAEE